MNEGGRKTKRLDLAKWVADAWGKISKEAILHTWKSIGIKAETNVEPEMKITI